MVEGGMIFSVDAEGRAMKTLADGRVLHVQHRIYNALLTLSRSANTPSREEGWRYRIAEAGRCDLVEWETGANCNLHASAAMSAAGAPARAVVPAPAQTARGGSRSTAPMGVPPWAGSATSTH